MPSATNDETALSTHAAATEPGACPSSAVANEHRESGSAGRFDHLLGRETDGRSTGHRPGPGIEADGTVRRPVEQPTVEHRSGGDQQAGGSETKVEGTRLVGQASGLGGVAHNEEGCTDREHTHDDEEPGAPPVG